MKETRANNLLTENQIPKHIAIVMDGNGRFAKAQGKTRTEGHRIGKDNLKTIVGECIKQKIPYLSVFAFSSENWSRPEEEVSSLMELFVSSLNNESRELAENGVQLKIIGDISKFSFSLRKMISVAEALTKNNKKLILNVAINYGGRWDIINAAKKFAQQQLQKKSENKKTVFLEDDFVKELAFANCPEVDLLIRTGGEKRISNFMLWQIAYAEIYFSDVLWPNFNALELTLALNWYSSRERRFGKISEQLIKK